MNYSSRPVLWTILLSATLTVMAGSLLSSVINLIRDNLGVEPASAGLIITTHGLFIAIFSPLMGILIDKIGARKPFIFGLFLYGLAGGSGLFITSYWPLIISRAVFGIAVAATLNSITVLILNLYKGAERDKVMGWRGSANSLGGIIWPLIGGFLGNFSWHLPFAAYLFSLPLCFLAFGTMPETPREESKNEGAGGSILGIYKSTPILFAIYGLMFLSMVLLYVIVVFLPQLLGEMGITNTFYISLFVVTAAIASGLISLNYKVIRSKLSYKMIVLVTLAFWAVGFITISQAFSVWIIVIGVVFFGIGRGMILPAIMVWIGEKVPFWFRGRAVSYLGTLGFIGQFLSPILFGQSVPIWGLDSVFLVAGALNALVFLLFLVCMKS